MPSGRRGAPGEGFHLSGFCRDREDRRPAIAGVGTFGEREERKVFMEPGNQGWRRGCERKQNPHEAPGKGVSSVHPVASWARHLGTLRSDGACPPRRTLLPASVLNSFLRNKINTPVLQTQRCSWCHYANRSVLHPHSQMRLGLAGIFMRFNTCREVAPPALAPTSLSPLVGTVCAPV